MDNKLGLLLRVKSKIVRYYENYINCNRDRISAKCSVSILCFHDIIDNGGDEYSIALNEFSDILELISEQCICLDDAISGRRAGVVVSFDDGYESVYQKVFPLFLKKNIPFIAYISTDFIGKSGYLTQNQIAEMAQFGDICTIGSHMCSHNKTRYMADEDILREWKLSRNILEEITGKEIQHAALPYGSVVSCSRKSIKLGLESGYKTIATTIAIPYKGGSVVPRFVYQKTKEFSPVLPRKEKITR